MTSIFDVTPDDLSTLTESAAVDVFRELLWAEATAMGIGKDLINVPSAINVADGGIDAEVDIHNAEGGQGLIPSPLEGAAFSAGRRLWGACLL